MKVLIINAIVYTSETGDIPRVNSIRDTMIYDQCLAFAKAGHEVTLYAAEPYKPLEASGGGNAGTDEYPFDIVWGKCAVTGVFLPNRLPWMPELKKYLKQNKFDLIISSEVFSFGTLYAYKQQKENLIVWHEIAKHQKMMHQIPSKIWYNVIAKHIMKKLHVVARSVEAREFIRRYCSNTEDTVIDHGVNLSKFGLETSKDNQFAVCSQLIPRKRIDGIIKAFKAFAATNDDLLYIIGSGEEEGRLKELVREEGLEEKVVFTGKLSHSELMPILAKSQALLVNTIQDNNMISIVESIAVGTPVLTTCVPHNASYIDEFKLGIAKDEWGSDELRTMVEQNTYFVNNCAEYRERLSTDYRVRQFIELMK